MDAEAGCDPGDAMAGLVIAIGDSLYFAIPWGDLLRFRVPPVHTAAVKTLVEGGEPVAARDVEGFVDAELSEGARLLLRSVLADPPDERGRPAVRRLAAWAVLD
ncbi:MAG: hypothetical protein ACRDJ9_20725 [Dehalococcoidia bacterium]